MKSGSRAAEVAETKSAGDEPPSQVNPLRTETTENAAANLQKKVKWIPYDEAKLKSLRSQGKPVALFFTADWNLHGNSILRAIEKELQVVPATAQDNLMTLMLADWTQPSDDIRLALKELGSQSIPTLALYPPLPSAPPLILRDPITIGQVEDAIMQMFDKILSAPLQIDVTAASVDKTGSPLRASRIFEQQHIIPLEIELRVLMDRYGKGHPSVKAIQKRLEFSKEQLEIMLDQERSQ